MERMERIAAILETAANRIEAGDWRAHSDGRRLSAGWLVGATFCNDMGAEYAARRAFAEWWAPGEYRNDGGRVNETAGERGERLGAIATAAALRQFVALQREA